MQFLAFAKLIQQLWPTTTSTTLIWCISIWFMGNAFVLLLAAMLMFPKAGSINGSGQYHVSQLHTSTAFHPTENRQ